MLLGHSSNFCPFRKNFQCGWKSHFLLAGWRPRGYAIWGRASKHRIDKTRIEVQSTAPKWIKRVQSTAPKWELKECNRDQQCGCIFGEELLPIPYAHPSSPQATTLWKTSLPWLRAQLKSTIYMMFNELGFGPRPHLDSFVLLSSGLVVLSGAPHRRRNDALRSESNGEFLLWGVKESTRWRSNIVKNSVDTDVKRIASGKAILFTISIDRSLNKQQQQH
jgi:hypothetical protein